MTTSVEDLIASADALYKKLELRTLYDTLLPHKDSKDANIVWRLARATCELGKNSLDEADKKKYINEAFDYSKVALELDDNNFVCHLWYGMLLECKNVYEGTVQEITDAFIVKDHFMKANMLNPSSAMVLYCLGLWCFRFAKISFYESKIVHQVHPSSPPTSTFEEAKKYFDDAEKAEPRFLPRNMYMRGRVRMELGEDKVQIKEIFESIFKYDVRTEDDKQCVKETEEQLKSF